LSDFTAVAFFSLRKVRVQFFDLTLVASFRLPQQFAVEMFDLRDSLRNKGIQPADGSRKELHVLGFRSVAGGGLRPSRFVSSAGCSLGTQRAIKFDHLRGNAGVDHLVDRKMDVTSSRRYECGRFARVDISHTDEAR